VIASLLVVSSAVQASSPARGRDAIVFVRGTVGSLDLYLVDGTGRVTQLTDSPNVFEGGPDWFPGGKKIAFDAAVSPAAGDIFTMNVRGSGVRQLTSDLAADAAPAVSPDGSRIAFFSDRSGDGEVWIMDADGSNQIQLTSAAGFDLPTGWTPDGRILFHSTRDGDLDVYVMDADGGNVVNLTNDTAFNCCADASPDGTMIAFISDPDSDGIDDLFVMDPSGAGVTNITNSPAVDENSPSWSPNSRRIVFGRASGGLEHIFVIRVDGRSLTQLTTGMPMDFDPDWR
jgi:TolB protein